MSYDTITSRLVLTALVFPLSLSNLLGQQKPPLKLALKQAVEMALHENPQVQIAVLNFAESKENRTVARSGLLPQASFRLGQQVQRENIDALFGKPFPGIPQHIGPFQSFQAGPIFSFPLLDLTAYRRWQSASHEVLASGHDSQNVREQTVLLVVSQYLGSLQASASVVAAQSRVQLSKALFEQASDLQKNGVGTGLDTLRAQVQFQNDQQRLIEAQTQLKTSLFGLVRLLNVDPSQEIELTDQMSFFETPEFQGDTTLNQAYAERPEMLALEEREREEKLARKQAGEERLPTLGVNGNWAYLGLSAATAIPTYTYAATVDVPLVTSGRIHADTVKADLELKKINQQRQDLRNQIALEVKTAMAQLESARHEVDVANEGVKLAQEEVNQARDRFAAGVANNIEVVTAQDALERANDNQISALYSYNQSRADLARATGHIEDLYAK
ncbi:MAG TPA: TolC family protein [Terriglobia bacterium]|nr:TolC family protein [Terriglobia bacterium]